MLEEVCGLKSEDFKLIRRYAVQFVYQQDLNQQLFLHDAVLNNFIIQNNVAENQKEFLKSLLNQIFNTRQEVDAIIEKYAINWKLSRIAKVDLAVLRVAIVELRERLETDSPVIISEATSIAEEFGSTNSHSFVNGILDTIAKNVRKK